MNRQRRETIIQEIEYWKRSRLLPEHYCDYLLALYTEGDARSHGRRWRSSLAAGLCLLLPAAALVIYFTELSFVLQTLLFALFLAACLFFCWRWRNKRELLHFPLIGSAWILLMASILEVDRYFSQANGCASSCRARKLCSLVCCRPPASPSLLFARRCQRGVACNRRHLVALRRVVAFSAT